MERRSKVVFSVDSRREGGPLITIEAPEDATEAELTFAFGGATVKAKANDQALDQLAKALLTTGAKTHSIALGFPGGEAEACIENTGSRAKVWVLFYAQETGFTATFSLSEEEAKKLAEALSEAASILESNETKPSENGAES